MHSKIFLLIISCTFLLQGCDSPENWEILEKAARIEMEKKEFDIAEALLLSAYDEPTQRRWLGANKEPRLAGAFGHLGLLYHMEKCQLDKSEQNYSRALMLLKEVEGGYAMLNCQWRTGYF